MNRLFAKTYAKDQEIEVRYDAAELKNDQAAMEQAMADNVEETLGRKLELSPKQIEGYSSANWVLMDYRDVVIHIFDQENRRFYDLARIWRDGKEVDIESL